MKPKPQFNQKVLLKGERNTPQPTNFTLGSAKRKQGIRKRKKKRNCLNILTS